MRTKAIHVMVGLFALVTILALCVGIAFLIMYCLAFYTAPALVGLFILAALFGGHKMLAEVGEEILDWRKR